jgi:hypothetical protein
MSPRVRGLSLTRILAVLFGVVLLWPALRPSLVAAAPSSACAQRGSDPASDPANLDNEPAGLSAAEDCETESSVVGAAGVVPAHLGSVCDATRTSRPPRTRARWLRDHRVVARERGPPAV